MLFLEMVHQHRKWDCVVNSLQRKATPWSLVYKSLLDVFQQKYKKWMTGCLFCTRNKINVSVALSHTILKIFWKRSFILNFKDEETEDGRSKWFKVTQLFSDEAGTEEVLFDLEVQMRNNCIWWLSCNYKPLLSNTWLHWRKVIFTQSSFVYIRVLVCEYGISRCQFM